ncbi:retrovirus-related Pol polyprotein from transposon opus [Trichonephila clavipes]|nr:retrovirus-related Pol polyprotein from transposon opus [Trichonephila clavipes]
MKQHGVVHTNEKPYLCNICGVGFGRKDNRERHYLVHATEKPFKCDKCEMSYKQKRHLDKHYEIHLDETNTSIVKCQICERCFSSQKALGKHARQEHPELKECFVCDVCALITIRGVEVAANQGAATILRDDIASTISDSGRSASLVNAYSRAVSMSRKQIPAVDAAASPAADILGRKFRLFVKDRETGCQFLVDSGADVSILPWTKTKKLLIDLHNRKLIDGVTNLSIKGEVATIQENNDLSTVNRASKYFNLLKLYPDLTKPNLVNRVVKHEVKHHILTTGQPIYSKARQLAPDKLKLAKQEFQFMLDNDIIRPSKSQWASPLHLVNKKGWHIKTMWRLQATQRTDNTRSIPIAEEDKEKTAITTPFGLYEFNTMSFGLRNAPSTFQRFITEVLYGLDFVFPYLDDVLVASSTEEEHSEHLKMVFERFQQYGLRINVSKSVMGAAQVEYLGFLITAEGSRPLPEKVQAIFNYKLPETIHDLRTFLGMINFYRRYLKDAAKTQAPLHELLKGAKKKDRRKVHWTDDTRRSFEKCKTDLAEAALLSFPRSGLPLSLCTDASDFAVGAVLQQLENERWKPIAFYSKKLNETQTRFQIFQLIHGLAHPGIKSTVKLMTEKYVWSDIKKQVREWAKACIRCQKCKVSRHTKSKLGEFEQPDERFSVVHIDLIGKLPPSEGMQYCLTCIDRFSCWMEAIPIPEITAEIVGRAFYEKWICRFGVPAKIVTDQGRQFEAELFRSIAAICGAKVAHTTSYHPQCNGKVERLHRTLKGAIKLTTILDGQSHYPLCC